MERAWRLAAGSVGVALAVLALKLAAWWLTGSVALTGGRAGERGERRRRRGGAGAVRFSALPPDANHPYGHTKAEYFSAVLEGALIIVAAVAILHAAWGAWLARGRRTSR